MLTLMAVALGWLLGLLIALPARYWLRRLAPSERPDRASQLGVPAN